ncbi:hypothetical protein [Gemmobacter serpentinus]|uniref:hypothetical protein n=1 Tax=Gemmobacter serpentinus TaxID=2652247 RepID=UPI00124D7AB2|nr:hypothetical protein [Gemmobacter serpentinus]
MRSLAALGLIALGIGLLPQAARAECLGQGCYDGLIWALLSLAAYGALLLVVIVLAILRKWRVLGRMLLVVLVLAVGVPLLSQGWQAVQLWRMERHEVTGTPPALDSRKVLMIAPRNCSYHACEAVLRGAWEAGALVLPADALSGLDLTESLDLRQLPLERWWHPQANPSSEMVQKLLTQAERAEVTTVDYLVIAAAPYYLSEPGVVEAALRDNPSLSGIGGGTVVKLGLAPLATPGQLSLRDLRFDILDLWAAGQALGLPLAAGNWQSADNTMPEEMWDRAARAICPASLDGALDYNCSEALR